MIITKIESQKKNQHRFNLYLNHEFWLGVSEETLIKFLIIKGKEIDELQKLAIEEYENVQKLYHQVLNYLSYSLRTKQEIEKYIEEHLDPTLENRLCYQESIIKKLESMGYIDDLNYAKSYVRTQALIAYKGPNLIKYELMHKGIEEALIHNALFEYSDQQQFENIVKLSEKYSIKQKTLSHKMFMQKLYQYLYQKGFSKDQLTQIDFNQIMPKKDINDKNLLDKEANKFIRVKGKKFTGYHLKQKLSETLLRKAFKYDDISEWIHEHQKYFEGELNDD